MNNLFDTVKRKAELWTQATGQKTEWFKVWQNVILLILCITNAISFITGIASISSSASTTNVITFVLCIIQTGLVVTAFFFTRNCDKISYIVNLIFIVWQLAQYVITIIQMFMFNLDTDAILEVLKNDASLSADIDPVKLQQLAEITVSITIVVTIAMSVAFMVLYTLNLVYFIKRKAIYTKSFEEIQDMIDKKPVDFN